jgi:hypothetical protein
VTTLARKFLAILLSVLIAVPAIHAQERQLYSQAELDQMLAPIALYPDALLSQVLMASTYPLEVVAAARWSRAHPGLQGDEAVRTAQDKDWDPSVKSLLALPNLLARMDEKLEWTTQLGEAFLAQEQQVMDTVQDLRRKARAAGRLAPDERVRIVEDGSTIIIEPASPHVVYVPYYDPWVVYGTWWWPAYPPVEWAPWPGYVVVRPGFWWGVGIGISTGFFFGSVNWPHRHVIVRHVDVYYVRPPAYVRRDVTVHRVIEPGRWQHDPTHRRGIVYRSPEVQRRFAPPPPPREVRREPRPGVVPAPERRREVRPAPGRPSGTQPAPRLEQRREQVRPAPVPQREERREQVRPAPSRSPGGWQPAPERKEMREDRRGHVMPPAFRASAPARVQPRMRVEPRVGPGGDGGWRNHAGRLERRG